MYVLFILNLRKSSLRNKVKISLCPTNLMSAKWRPGTTCHFQVFYRPSLSLIRASRISSLQNSRPQYINKCERCIALAVCHATPSTPLVNIFGQLTERRCDWWNDAARNEVSGWMQRRSNVVDVCFMERALG